jgi:K(+)-stimulated pyrophosphate-energized sodium pump
VAAIAVGLVLMRSVLAADTGTPRMRDIAAAIQEGALAYLRRQFRTIAVILIPLAVVVFVTSTAVLRPDGTEALSAAQSGTWRTITFLVGCAMSGLTGFIGMGLAVRGNVRTAAAARTGSLPASLRVAFRTGGVAGMFTVGLGLLGATVIILAFQNTASTILIGFGFGGSLLALFLRVGGGIFTKAADVGADLVGKVEAGIPEDDARNPATIADNVGDNVGDCAGMAADLFESYEVTLVASIILGVAAFRSIGANPALGLVFPVVVRAIGVLASIVGVYAVRATDTDRSPLTPINRGFATAGVLTVIGTLAVAQFYVGNLDVFWAVVAGLVLAQVASRLTEYYTSTETAPVREIATASRTGPATTVLSGVSSGMESSVWAITAIAGAIAVALALGDGNLQYALYLVALCGMGMLATTGVVVSEDTFGPVADNAAGIAEMSGEFGGEAGRIRSPSTPPATRPRRSRRASRSGRRSSRRWHCSRRTSRRSARSCASTRSGRRCSPTPPPRSTSPTPRRSSACSPAALLSSCSAPSRSVRSAAPRGSWSPRSGTSSRRSGSWRASTVPTTDQSSTSAHARRCVSSPRRHCSPCSRPSSSASAWGTPRSARSSRPSSWSGS